MKRGTDAAYVGCRRTSATVEFGRRLFDMRDRKNWSLQDVADRAGLSIGCVCKLENGHNYPHPKTVNKLAKAFKVSVQFLRRGHQG